MDYSVNSGDRLLEHYAALKADKSHINIEAARAAIDNAGAKFSGLLGRYTEADEAKGYSPRYVYLRALINAGLSTEEEFAEWEALVAADTAQDALDEGVDGMAPKPEQEGYDPDLPPASWDVEAPEPEYQPLLDNLHHLQALKAEASALEARIKEVQSETIELQRSFGRPIALVNPVTHAPEIAGVRQSETLVVDAAKLLQALVDYYGDEDQAEAIWAGVLKPREVDTKKDGLFHQAVMAHSDDVNGIPPEVVQEVAAFKPNSPYIGFSKPQK